MEPPRATNSIRKTIIRGASNLHVEPARTAASTSLHSESSFSNNSSRTSRNTDPNSHLQIFSLPGKLHFGMSDLDRCIDISIYITNAIGVFESYAQSHILNWELGFFDSIDDQRYFEDMAKCSQIVGLDMSNTDSIRSCCNYILKGRACFQNIITNFLEPYFTLYEQLRLEVFDTICQNKSVYEYMNREFFDFATRTKKGINHLNIGAEICQVSSHLYKYLFRVPENLQSIKLGRTTCVSFCWQANTMLDRMKDIDYVRAYHQHMNSKYNDRYPHKHAVVEGFNSKPDGPDKDRQSLLMIYKSLVLMRKKYKLNVRQKASFMNYCFDLILLTNMPFFNSRLMQSIRYGYELFTSPAPVDDSYFVYFEKALSNFLHNKWAGEQYNTCLTRLEKLAKIAEEKRNPSHSLALSYSDQEDRSNLSKNQSKKLMAKALKPTTTNDNSNNVSAGQIPNPQAEKYLTQYENKTNGEGEKEIQFGEHIPQASNTSDKTVSEEKLLNPRVSLSNKRKREDENDDYYSLTEENPTKMKNTGYVKDNTNTQPASSSEGDSASNVTARPERTDENKKARWATLLMQIGAIVGNRDSSNESIFEIASLVKYIVQDFYYQFPSEISLIVDIARRCITQVPFMTSDLRFHKIIKRGYSLNFESIDLWIKNFVALTKKSVVEYCHIYDHGSYMPDSRPSPTQLKYPPKIPNPKVSAKPFTEHNEAPSAKPSYATPKLSNAPPLSSLVGLHSQKYLKPLTKRSKPKDYLFCKICHHKHPPKKADCNT